MHLNRVTHWSDPLFPPALALYETAFPLHEQRTHAAQKAVLSAPEYHFDVITDEGSFVGLALYWETADFLYLEHFAILSDLRGKHYGSRVLELLMARKKPVILEIDPPVDPVSIRRKHFYERLGLVTHPFHHVHPPYRAGNAGHSLVILACPAIDQDCYQQFSAYLNRTVMAGLPSA